MNVSLADMGLYKTWQRARSESMGIPSHIIDKFERAGMSGSPDFYVGPTAENNKSTLRIFISKVFHRDNVRVHPIPEVQLPPLDIEQLRAASKPHVSETCEE